MKYTQNHTTIPTILMLCVLASSLLLLGAEGITVYVTKSGKKYHLETCSSLSQSKIAVRLEDAIHSGYGPCSVCNPPTLISNSGVSVQQEKDPSLHAAEPLNSKDLYRVNMANLARTSEADLSRMILAEVVSHIDGDTIRVRISNPLADLKTVETIRMIGVDTPETVHPNKPVEYFGKEASNFTKQRLLGKQVYLAFDWDLRDRYGRLLAYIYTPDGTCFNAALIQEGYGYAYSTYPFQFKHEFIALEQAAQQDNRGLWGKR
jgi:micrococcal nuclease